MASGASLAAPVRWPRERPDGESTCCWSAAAWPRCAAPGRCVGDGFDGSILIVGDGAAPPYNRPPLSKELLRDDLPDELVAGRARGVVRPPRCRAATGDAVTELDPGARARRLPTGRASASSAAWSPPAPSRAGSPVPGARARAAAADLADARRLARAAISAGADAPVVVVGGGFIGVEVASGLADARAATDDRRAGGQLWGGSLGARAGRVGRERLGAAGVEVRLGAAVTRLEPDAAWVGDERIEAAFVVVGIGVRAAHGARRRGRAGGRRRRRDRRRAAHTIPRSGRPVTSPASTGCASSTGMPRASPASERRCSMLGRPSRSAARHGSSARSAGRPWTSSAPRAMGRGALDRPDGCSRTSPVGGSCSSRSSAPRLIPPSLAAWSMRGRRSGLGRCAPAA